MRVMRPANSMLLGLLTKHVRFRSSTAATSQWVDDMLGYVRKELGRGKHEAMLDILKSGIQQLEKVPPEEAAVPRARIFLGMSEVEADRSCWRSSGDAAALAAQEAGWLDLRPGASPSVAAGLAVQEEATRCGVRATLAGQGLEKAAWDLALMGRYLASERYKIFGKTPELARAFADAVSQVATVGLARQHRMFAAKTVQDALVIAAETIDQGGPKDGLVAPGTLHESGSPGVGTTEAGDPAQGLPKQDTSGAGLGMTNETSAMTVPPMQTYQQCGSERYLQGDLDAARELYRMAIASELHSAWAVNGELSRILLPPAAAGEVVASAWSGVAQLEMEAGKWEAAEEAVGNALAAAEGVSGADHPRVAGPVMMMGGVLARTGRVQLAEGMYRGAVKLIGLRDGYDVIKYCPVGVHSSLSALLCWRYAQLLAVLPKREHDMSDWASKGKELFKGLGLGDLDIEDMYGAMDALRPKGRKGRRVITDVSLRRVLFGPPGETPKQ